MRLAFLNLTGGGISGGYKKYLQNILPRLVDDQGIKSILCATPESLKIKDWIEPSNKIRHITCNKYKPFLQWMDFKLKAEIYKFSPDIIFIPIERPFSFKKVNVVHMLQNMEPFVKNSLLNNNKINVKNILQKYIGLNALKRSDGIICPSNFVKSYLSETISSSTGKMALVYHGIDKATNDELSSPKTINNISVEFIFTAGSIRPARGLDDLIKALFILKEKNIEIKLFISGSSNIDSKGYLDYLKNMIKNYKLSNSIIFTGDLNNKEMSWCYKNSKMFVMTSHVESFGMIAGEALAHGCINISTDSPCLPEVFGDCAYYYKSGDSIGLAHNIQHVLSLDHKQLEKRNSEAVKRSKMFSWNICVNRTVEFLIKVVKSNRNGIYE